jgi:cytidylate kinase
VVALDGPASSGKSSVGAAAAARLGLRFLDTGLIYRAVTTLALREGVATGDADRLVRLVGRITLTDDGTGRLTRVMIDGADCTDEARGPDVDGSVSAVARVPEVRDALLAQQRALAADGGVVVAGRDIGTVVLPDAPLKLFLDASVEERAARRIEERGLDPDGGEAAAVRDQLRARDLQDRTRAVAPLRPADDARIIETDGNTFERTVDLVTDAIEAAGRGRKRASSRKPKTRSHPAPHAVTVAEPEPEPEPEPGAAAAAVMPAASPVPPSTPTTPVAEQAAATTREPLPAEPVRTSRTGLLEVAMRLDNDQTMLVRMCALVSRIGARLFANVDVKGLERIPRTGPVILAINHASNADPFVTGAWITTALRRRRIHWLGKRELFGWPIFGWLAAHGGVHPVERGTADIEAYRLATRILERGFVLLIFPEGTRSPTGALREAKDGMATLAMRTGATIVPIGINDSDRVWPKGRRIPQPIPRRTIRVRVGEPFRVEDLIPRDLDRRAAKRFATTAIMGKIAALLEPRQRGFYADVVPATADARDPGATPEP